MNPCAEQSVLRPQPSTSLAQACSPADIARFMKQVDKLPCGCWFWTGARSRGKKSAKAQRAQKWYGTFFVNKQVGRVRAHRFSCEVIGKKGPLPKGHDRSHKCDFSLCVNPDCIEYELKEVNQRKRIERARAEKAKPVCRYCGDGLGSYNCFCKG